MNLRRMFANAIVRRLAYVVVALLFAAAASLLGMGEARAAHLDANREVAYQHCRQRIDDYVATILGMGQAGAQGTCDYETANGGQYRECVTTNAYPYCGAVFPPGDGVHRWPVECPEGGSWNEETKSCYTCDINAPPLGPGHFQCAGADFDSCSYIVCVDGCGFDQPGGGHDGYVIDGRMWARTDGWMPRGQTCEVGSLPGLGTPPTDRDGDGTSDANDPSPNNPGSGGAGDEDGQGQDEDGSSSCGGPGQPECAEDGSNAGSGKGNTSGGGGNCQSPPSSTGDAILAQIAYQAWATRCAVEAQGQGGGGTGPGTGDGDGAKEGTLKGMKDWLDGNGEVVPDADDPWMDGMPDDPSDWDLGLGGGSCPAPISTTISLGGTSAPIEFSFQPMCDLAGLLNSLFKALGALIAAYIIAGVRR